MKTKINELCQKAGITTAYQLQKATGLSPSQAARLYKDEVEGISLTVLGKLCETLGTDPNEILGYEPPKSAKGETVKGRSSESARAQVKEARKTAKEKKPKKEAAQFEN
jgi:DNA-binding Xre family transcriptional regulator